MFEAESEIVEYLKSELSDRYELIASTDGLGETEIERDMCPAIIVEMGEDNDERLGQRNKMQARQSITTWLCFAPEIRPDYSGTLAGADDGRKSELIRVLSNYRPPSARAVLQYGGSGGPIRDGFGVTQIPIEWRLEINYEV